MDFFLNIVSYDQIKEKIVLTSLDPKEPLISELLIKLKISGSFCSKTSIAQINILFYVG